MGKTYLTKMVLAKVSKYIPHSHITIADFKGDSSLFFLNDCERYFRFDSALDALNRFYAQFTEAQKSGTNNGFHLLCFDEWTSCINSLDKRDAEDAKKKLSNLLMLGRSYDYHVLISQQRLSAEDFGKSRDQFSVVITLGNISKEVAGMLYSDYRDLLKNDRQRGTGYMLINGSDFQSIVVPKIASMANMDNAIKEAVMR